MRLWDDSADGTEELPDDEEEIEHNEEECPICNPNIEHNADTCPICRRQPPYEPPELPDIDEDDGADSTTDDDEV